MPQPAPQREGARISHSPAPAERSSGSSLGEDGVFGRAHSWSSPHSPVCVLPANEAAPVWKAELEAEIRASPAHPTRKHPAFRQVSVLAHPWENQRHTWLLTCALRKKRNNVLPTPRDAVTQSWPSTSCLDSWAQWEHFGLVPAPGRCSGGQAWPLLPDCLGSELPGLQESMEHVWIHTFLGLPYVCFPNAPLHPSSHQGKAGSAHAPC